MIDIAKSSNISPCQFTSTFVDQIPLNNTINISCTDKTVSKK